MSFIEILLIGIGLSMDAACVSMSNGMCFQNTRLKRALTIGLAFGLFQGLMPLIGYYAGSVFSEQISAFDHWIALVLLVFIGGKMIYDALKGSDDDSCSTNFTLKLLFVQAIATSIDALTVGITFAAIRNVNIYFAVSIIAITTFAFSVVAVYIGKKIGTKLNSKAELFGGTILILIGLKIFIEHMWF
ncbi:manganese efflux pump MntP family protein [Paludicola sp. MB14-C6]|uniref:manganese efflux pump MntP n=1 Tax=Paludihabitans sp. MB14-C6 TaxID=3070656 RepID=UPI0027DC105C|nr:manganese efflux pump MntP family protein [Paludicola sp. MB14-C6]WMJ23053.1 manganese efflux pump MntP family protein [Paludicola sp. MB14-C6]